MAECVGYAKCPECGFENAGVFRNKRKRLLLNCPDHDGVKGCSIFPYQSDSAQLKLKNRTRFISENPAPAVDDSEKEKPAVVPEVIPEKLPPVSEVVPEAVPEKKSKFSFFR